MKLKQNATSLISRTKTGKKIIESQHYRIILSALVAFAFNLLYALYHGLLGFLNHSLWFNFHVCLLWNIATKYEDKQIFLMNAMTEAVVCLFVLILSLSIIIKTKRF